MIQERHPALGVLLPLRAHEPLADDAGALDGAGEFRHDRFLQQAGLAGLVGPLRLCRRTGQVRGVQVRGVQGGRTLQVTDLLLQRIDLRRLLVRPLLGGERRGRRHSARVAGALTELEASTVDSSSCRPCTSFFKMRIDWPSERAASGSFFDPNSTMSTTATIRIFQGLSKRSLNMSVLHSQGDADQKYSERAGQQIGA